MSAGDARGAEALLARCARRLAAAGLDGILEDEGLELAEALGLSTPPRFPVRGPSEVSPDALEALPGERVVVKVVSPAVVHRSRAGGVRVVPRSASAVRSAVEELAGRFPGPQVRFLVETFVEGDPGGELLLGLRWTAAWGPVVVVAPGGVDAEARAASAGDGPWMARRVSGGWGGPPLPGFGDDGAHGDGGADRADASAARLQLGHIAARLLELGRAGRAHGLVDLEFNPIRWVGGAWTALDALGRLETPPAEGGRPPAGTGVDPGRVLDLLRPRTLAVVGASARGRNPGRIILQNVLEAGFDPGAVQVVKPGIDRLEGCRCVPDVESLDPVDLLAVAVAADPAAAVVERAAEAGVARGILLVAGGMDVGPPGHRPLDRVTDALGWAREADPPGAPVLVGPNSLGIRSVPGRFDTLFLPRDRVRFPGGPPAPVALVSQSGAFALTRLAALPHLEPRFVVTLGNQADVTLGRVAEALARDPEVRATGWYVEGFAEGDGARWLEALEALVARGCRAVVYAAGRSPEGRHAAASHTASVAGDPAVLRSLCREAGVAVVDTLHAFEDTLALLAAWADREPPGPRLAVLSNAGFETVAAADGAAPLRIPDLDATTRTRLERVLDEAGVADFVPVVHPLDVTPMLADGPFVAAAEALLEDPGIDVGVVGCVPLTPALRTPLDGPGRDGDGEGEGPGGGVGVDVTTGLVDLWRRTRRPWLVVLDAGPGHDWMRSELRRAGIPVLAGMDRVGPALRAVLGR